MIRRLLLLVLIMATTAFLGELKMIPFGDSFRFSLGTAAYFFGLIWFTRLRPLETGLAVGVFLLLFRSLLTAQTQGGAFWEYLPNHVPAVVYYLVFASFLTLTDLRKRLDRPLLVGAIGTAGDFLGNIGELLTRTALGAQYSFGLDTVLILLLFGSLRSFFVVGLYNMLMIRQVRALGDQQKEQIERLLLINSSLYEEGFYLRKSMRHIEDITRSSYDLYKQLKTLDDTHARSALSIAEEVHEVKKDSQRILAGLDKVMRQETFSERLTLVEIATLVAAANRKYAQMLGKQIDIRVAVYAQLTTTRIYPLISILNNLVANAVESIQTAGTIGIEVEHRQDELIWHVWDDGPGVAPADTQYIWQPGYTTKYDAEGNPSTGIGLSHCRDLAATLNGELSCIVGQGLTRFRMVLPARSLVEKEARPCASI